MTESQSQSPEERGLANMREFRDSWGALVSFGEATVANAIAARSGAPNMRTPDETRWTHLLEDANRHFATVDRHLESRTTSAGHDAFQYVLGNIGRASWLTGRGGVAASAFRESATKGNASLNQALGRLEARITEAADAPLDDLEVLAETVRVTSFIDDLRAAERRRAAGLDREAVSRARDALEMATKEVANILNPAPKGRQYGQAVDILAQRGLIHPKTAAALKARDVSGYGWISAFGSHRDETDDTLEAGDPEAVLAIDWVRAIIRYLLQKLRVLLESPVTD